MRKGVLVVHIVSAGAWIGIDIVMGVVIFTALPTLDLGMHHRCVVVPELRCPRRFMLCATAKGRKE
jgi:hypothetical protein